VDTSTLDLEVFFMAVKTVRYTPEFKRQMVDLVRSGRKAASLAKEFAPQPGASRCGSSRTLVTLGVVMVV
jgi:hypothetical protein